MQAATIGMFDEVDRQLAGLADAAVMPRTAASPPVERTEPEPLLVLVSPPLVPAMPEPVTLPPTPVAAHRAVAIAAAIIAAIGLALIAAVNLVALYRADHPLTGRAAVDSVVGRIVAAESRGAVDPKNKRSSAAGPAQFLDDTWLELVRADRPDLMKGRTREQLLALRHKAGLARELAMRFAERNAALLRRRGLPVTAGTLYLAHFAGPAGAAALLSAPADADAATVMAKADATGKVKREQIVKANPFLDKFTVADIRRWADRKMDGPTLVLTELLSATTKK